MAIVTIDDSTAVPNELEQIAAEAETPLGIVVKSIYQARASGMSDIDAQELAQKLQASIRLYGNSIGAISPAEHYLD